MYELKVLIMSADTAKKLPVANILKQSFRYFNSKPLTMLVLTVLNYVTILLGVYTWSKPEFFIILILGYILWSYFFRFYFNKKPYLQVKSMTSSLAPSVKILVIGFVVLTVIILLPFAPLFLGILGPHADSYLNFLKTYMQDSQTLDVFMGILLVFIAPYIFYRPFFAWIGSLLGRNGSLRYAMRRTKGNYWPLVMLLLVLNIPFALVEQIVRLGGFPQPLAFLIISPLVVYANIVIARCYEFFFIED